MADENDIYREEMPFNALPPMVIALAVLIGGTELLFQIGSYGLIGGPEAVGWRIAALEDYGFFDTVFEAMRAQNSWPLHHVIRFVTYAFVHVSITHALMVLVFVLALGKMVGETFGNLAVLIVFVVSALAGSLAYGLILDTNVPLLGGYPAAYGLIGAYTLMLWIGLGAMAQNQMRAFTLIGFLMGIQLIWALLLGGDATWIADLSGFAAGFAVSILLVPGAPKRIFQRLRRD